MNLKTLVVRGGFLGLVFLGVTVFSTENVFAASTVSGTVYDKQRTPLIDVDVELLNDLYQQIRRARTDGTGRYTFDGLNDGRYTLRALAFRYDMEDQSIPIEINTVDLKGTQGTSFQVVDFYLLPRKGGLAETELGIVFAQTIPADAKKVYDDGLRELANKRVTEGILALNKSIGIFPDYYVALHRLGKELFILKKYDQAAPFFYKAVQVNPKSATSFYYLGFSFYQMGKDFHKAALVALNQAYTMAPASAPVLYSLGKIEHSMGDLTNAEKHLLLAKKLSKQPVPEIHKELAQLYANEMKKYNEAATELETYLKSSKPDEAEAKQVRKVIGDLREKAKNQPSN